MKKIFGFPFAVFKESQVKSHMYASQTATLIQQYKHLSLSFSGAISDNINIEKAAAHCRQTPEETKIILISYYSYLILSPK